MSETSASAATQTGAEPTGDVPPAGAGPVAAPGQPLLGIYLNDHLAAATGGVELARRIARSERGGPVGTGIEPLAAELAQDRAALLAMMRTLAVPVRRYKVLGGWAAERMGRLKPNGRLLRRSPLSPLLELEGLTLLVRANADAWRTLYVVAAPEGPLDPKRLGVLLDRAARQTDLLQELHTHAAAHAFG